MKKINSIKGIKRAVETALWNELFYGSGTIKRIDNFFKDYGEDKLNSLYDFEDEWNRLETGKAFDDLVSEKLNIIIKECGKLVYKGKTLHMFGFENTVGFIEEGVISFEEYDIKQYIIAVAEAIYESEEFWDGEEAFNKTKTSLSKEVFIETYNSYKPNK